MIEYARLRSPLIHTSMCRHSPLHPQHWWESAFSLPCLSFVPPSLPPSLLQASLQPSPLPLPRSSFVSAWFSSLSCSVQPCLAFTEQPEPNAAQRPIWAQGRRKGSTSNCRASQENKAALTPELIHRLGESECVLTHIDLFPQSWNTLIISVSALVCRLTHIPWFILGEQQTCYLKKSIHCNFLISCLVATCAAFYLSDLQPFWQKIKHIKWRKKAAKKQQKKPNQQTPEYLSMTHRTLIPFNFTCSPRTFRCHGYSG